ncbi:MAG: hypothetical protein Q7T54_02110, partial [Candidatus Levybacteria bacterium]|nr:hypothetical protein [Candidatus Levybacteria bacterium]
MKLNSMVSIVNAPRLTSCMIKLATEMQELSKNTIDFCISKANASYFLKDYEQSVSWIYFASTVAWTIHPGYFYSRKMEDLLSHISTDCFSNSELPHSIETQYQPENCVVHIVSTVSGTGGHSRVVEKWIKNCKVFYPEQTHSICLTQQRTTELPDWILTLVDGVSGRISVLPNNQDFLVKAALLRKICNKANLIVLHIHPNDPVANLAFSCSSFTKKILFFNHADHVFSLGGMISDAIVDFRLSGKRVTKARRLCSKSFLLPIPLVDGYKNDHDCNRIEQRLHARKSLGLDLGCRIILTIGDEYKYKKSLGYDFIDCVRRIFRKDSSVIIIGIGLPPKNCWKYLSEEFYGRFVPLGRIKDRSILEQYYLAADIYMEGFPF